jgi:hypothetical protein
MKIPQEHHPPDIVEARKCVGSCSSTSVEFRQLERNPLGKIAKFVARQVHQFADCPGHRFLHRLTAPIAAFGRGPCDGGGGCIACDRNEVEECPCTCIHEPTTGATRPVKDGVGVVRQEAEALKDGRVR